MAAQRPQAGPVLTPRPSATGAEGDPVRETFFYELLGPFADGGDHRTGDQLALHSLRYQAIVHVQPAGGFDYAHPDLRAQLLPCFETADGTLAGPRFDVTLPADWLAIAGPRQLDPLDLALSGFALREPRPGVDASEPPADGRRIVRIRRDGAN